MSKISRKHSSTTKNNIASPAANTAPEPVGAMGGRSAGHTHPWVVGGVDYGPAMAAVNDLATWAFDLAAKDVEDWPEGARRVRIARRFVMSRLAGKRPRSAPIEDVLFTAGLLARLFESELSLDFSEMIAILEQLGLPSEVVPLRPRAQSSVRIPIHPNVTPLRPPPLGAICVAAPCSGCGSVLRVRSAA